MSADDWTYLVVQTHGRVGAIQLNRPAARNALCAGLMEELSRALDGFEQCDAIGAIVITGNEKSFAAGADIAEMARMDFSDAYLSDFITATWERASRCRKPLIAAVAGHALGGGCELAMMCDIVLAAENAKFAQPEVLIGVIPGAGGTQRLTRLIGKTRAMDLVLSGRTMDAAEALASGLASRVVPLEKLMPEALALAERIAALPSAAVMMAKEAVNRAYETTLAEGIRFERRLLHASFATFDKKEGMSAFLEKRAPAFRGR